MPISFQRIKTNVPPCLPNFCRKSSILGTLALIREKYNSVEGCVTTLGLLSPQEIAQLRANLVVAADDDVYQPPPPTGQA